MHFGESTYTQRLGTIEYFKDGQIIFQEGTAGSWIYVIAKGEVEIFKKIKGKEVIVDRLYQGECFGEVSFFDKMVRSAGAKAVGKVGLMLFDNEFLAEEYQKMPNCFRVLTEAMALRLRRLTKISAIVVANPKLMEVVNKKMQS